MRSEPDSPGGLAARQQHNNIVSTSPSTFAPETATPLIGFGSVHHARSRPRANRFRYPAYFLRMPLREADAGLSGLRLISHNRWNLFCVMDRDYGRRDGSSPLAWVEALLVGERISDVDGQIWLQTFPRVLGYVFNPVSFWFCHRANGALRAVLCEVSNTFGERHVYLLAHDDGRAIEEGEELCARKVFHVSPFCPIEGGYRIRFKCSGLRHLARIDYDDEAGPLLATSIEGAVVPLSDRALMRAFLFYPLFTFGVIARIHWQAIKLALKRVPFFSKPQPTRVKVSR